MEYELTLKYGAGGTTIIGPSGVAFAVLIIALVALIPRKHLIIPLLATIFFMPLGQRLVIFGLDLFILRIVLLACWIRLLLRTEIPIIKLTRIDRWLVIWVITFVVSKTLLWQTSGTLVNRLGFAFDILCVYFLVRILVHDFSEAERVVRILIAFSVPIAIAMLMEQLTGRNLFSILGGVPELTLIRDGSLRSQAAFAHPILAGSFGATSLPLCVGLWIKGRTRFAVLGFCAVTLITLTSASSGPILTYMFALGGLFMWSFRDHMRTIRRATVLTLILLHLVMKAPVWALIGRLSVFGASTAWHRYILLDQFIRRFGEWWFVGTKSSAAWIQQSNYLGLFDLTNMYVLMGVEGGLGTLVSFVAIIVVCFKGLGEARRVQGSDLAKQQYLWVLGVSLFAHAAAFGGIAYFDQTRVVWVVLIALISRAVFFSEKISNPAVMESAPSDQFTKSLSHVPSYKKALAN